MGCQTTKHQQAAALFSLFTEFQQNFFLHACFLKSAAHTVPHVVLSGPTFYDCLNHLAAEEN
jgi:hypothetical protein